MDHSVENNVGIKTEPYKVALMDKNIFPPGKYHLYEIFEILQKEKIVPLEHFKGRPDMPNVPLFKNYFHSIRPNIQRITHLDRALYSFE